MFWLGIIIGFILGMYGMYWNIEKKMKQVKTLEELKKLM